MKPTQQTIDKFRKTILDNTSEEHKKEILELKQGCKVLVWASEEEREKYKITVSALSPKGGRIYGYSKGFHERAFERKLLIEIIGSDITLEDVMVALENSLKMEFCIDFRGFIGRLKSASREESIYKLIDNDFDGCVRWNLTLPSHLQEEETLLAIIKLFE